MKSKAEELRAYAEENLDKYVEASGYVAAPVVNIGMIQASCAHEWEKPICRTSFNGTMDIWATICPKCHKIKSAFTEEELANKTSKDRTLDYKLDRIVK